MTDPRDKSADRVSSTPDELIKDLDVKLSEEEQNKVKGGAADIFAKLGDIKGESQDSKHKDEIEVLHAFSPPLPAPKRRV